MGRSPRVCSAGGGVHWLGYFWKSGAGRQSVWLILDGLTDPHNLALFGRSEQHVAGVIISQAPGSRCDTSRSQDLNGAIDIFPLRLRAWTPARPGVSLLAGFWDFRDGYAGDAFSHGIQQVNQLSSSAMKARYFQQHQESRWTKCWPFSWMAMSRASMPASRQPILMYEVFRNRVVNASTWKLCGKKISTESLKLIIYEYSS